MFQKINNEEAFIKEEYSKFNTYLKSINSDYKKER